MAENFQGVSELGCWEKVRVCSYNLKFRLVSRSRYEIFICTMLFFHSSPSSAQFRSSTNVFSSRIVHDVDYFKWRKIAAETTEKCFLGIIFIFVHIFCFITCQLDFCCFCCCQTERKTHSRSDQWSREKSLERNFEVSLHHGKGIPSFMSKSLWTRLGKCKTFRFLFFLLSSASNFIHSWNYVNSFALSISTFTHLLSLSAHSNS